MTPCGGFFLRHRKVQDPNLPALHSSHVSILRNFPRKFRCDGDDRKSAAGHFLPRRESSFFLPRGVSAGAYLASKFDYSPVTPCRGKGKFHQKNETKCLKNVNVTLTLQHSFAASTSRFTRSLAGALTSCFLFFSCFFFSFAH